MDELVKELFALAIKVNRETEKGVWAEYVGHVDGFEIRIAEGKNVPYYNNIEYDSICYMDNEYEKEAMQELAEMKNVLCGLLKEGKEVNTINE